MKLALLQLNSGIDPVANGQMLHEALNEAMAARPDLVLTPEATNLVQRDPARQAATIGPMADDPCLHITRRVAREHARPVILGSLIVRGEGGLAANRTVVVDASGEVAATYDKIHLFDAHPASDERYQESRGVVPGAQAVLAHVAGARVGLSVCYDVRFPALYHALARAGAELIIVPAAFTVPTGKAHWEVLLRARAIETGAFIAAPAQGGLHEDGRRTWGHSLLVGPWGEVMAALDDDAPGLLLAEIDPGAVEAARLRIASLRHTRPFAAPDDAA